MEPVRLQPRTVQTTAVAVTVAAVTVAAAVTVGAAGAAAAVKITGKTIVKRTVETAVAAEIAPGGTVETPFKARLVQTMIKSAALTIVAAVVAERAGLH